MAAKLTRFLESHKLEGEVKEINQRLSASCIPGGEFSFPTKIELKKHAEWLKFYECLVEFDKQHTRRGAFQECQRRVSKQFFDIDMKADVPSFEDEDGQVDTSFIGTHLYHETNVVDFTKMLVRYYNKFINIKMLERETSFIDFYISEKDECTDDFKTGNAIRRKKDGIHITSNLVADHRLNYLISRKVRTEDDDGENEVSLIFHDCERLSTKKDLWDTATYTNSPTVNLKWFIYHNKKPSSIGYYRLTKIIRYYINIDEDDKIPKKKIRKTLKKKIRKSPKKKEEDKDEKEDEKEKEEKTPKRKKKKIGTKIIEIPHIYNVYENFSIVPILKKDKRNPLDDIKEKYMKFGLHGVMRLLSIVVPENTKMRRYTEDYYTKFYTHEFQDEYERLFPQKLYDYEPTTISSLTSDAVNSIIRKHCVENVRAFVMDCITDDYADAWKSWFDLGAAIHNTLPNEEGRKLWHDFSLRIPDKYDMKKCDELWDVFHKNFEDIMHLKHAVRYKIQKSFGTIRYYARLCNKKHYIEIAKRDVLTIIKESTSPSTNDNIAMVAKALYEGLYISICTKGKRDDEPKLEIIEFNSSEHGYTRVDMTTFAEMFVEDIRLVYRSILSERKKERDDMYTVMTRAENAMIASDTKKDRAIQLKQTVAQCMKKIKSMEAQSKPLVGCVIALEGTKRRQIVVNFKGKIYDSKFLEYCDRNPYILRFRNGILVLDHEMAQKHDMMAIEDQKKREEQLKFTPYIDDDVDDSEKISNPKKYRMYFRDATINDYNMRHAGTMFYPWENLKDKDKLFIKDLWKKFFPNKGTRQTAKDAFAFSLNGVPEIPKKLYYLIGHGDNGKSVFKAILASIFNDDVEGGYMFSPGSEFLTLISSGDVSRPQPYYLNFRGKKLIVTDEALSNDKVRVNTGFQKFASGGGDLIYRLLHANEYEVDRIMFTMFSFLNTIPKLDKGDDAAFYNRAVMIEMCAKFIDEDEYEKAIQIIHEKIKKDVKREIKNKKFNNIDKKKKFYKKRFAEEIKIRGNLTSNGHYIFHKDIDFVSKAKRKSYAMMSYLVHRYVKIMIRKKNTGIPFISKSVKDYSVKCRERLDAINRFFTSQIKYVPDPKAEIKMTVLFNQYKRYINDEGMQDIGKGSQLDLQEYIAYQLPEFNDCIIGAKTKGKKTKGIYLIHAKFITEEDKETDSENENEKDKKKEDNEDEKEKKKKDSDTEKEDEKEKKKKDSDMEKEDEKEKDSDTEKEKKMKRKRKKNK